MPRKVDAAEGEADALAPQPLALHDAGRAAVERDAPAATHHAVPGDARTAGADAAKRPAHGTRAARHADERRDLAVGRDAATRDAAHDGVDALEEPRVRVDHRPGGGFCGCAGGGGGATFWGVA
jgi:hypothetical protein